MEYLPTCHRASFDSFLDDIDVKSAIDNSDGITKRQYQKDALKIEEVRQGILATSSKEDPFDVFICYKETDQNGGRTQDSVLAQDIYDRLTEKGYKVFFSRITLEDRVGTEYEPYIFAALNSAKAMIVVGTSKENLDSVWVKNEWSRFLAMMKKDRSKVILPCYKDMDPYDMPEALSVLQSYNMASIGFVQDLLRGISKIIGNDTKYIETGNKTVQDEIQPLLKRIVLFLEEGKFKEADEYSEKVLDKNPENAEPYLYKIMVKLQLKRESEFENNAKAFDDMSEYQMLLRFANDEIRKKIDDYRVYAEKNKLYNDALKLEDKTDVESVMKAKHLFEKLGEWKDSKCNIVNCDNKISDIKRDNKLRADKKARVIKLIGITTAIIVLIVLIPTVIVPAFKYHKALNDLEKSNYQQAYDSFSEINFLDSETRRLDSIEGLIKTQIDSGDYDKAISNIDLIEVKDEADRIRILTSNTLFDKGEFSRVISILNGLQGDTEVDELLNSSYNELGNAALETNDYAAAIQFYDKCTDQEAEKLAKYCEILDNLNKDGGDLTLVFNNAVNLGKYRDTQEIIDGDVRLKLLQYYNDSIWDVKSQSKDGRFTIKNGIVEIKNSNFSADGEYRVYGNTSDKYAIYFGSINDEDKIEFDTAYTLWWEDAYWRIRSKINDEDWPLK